MKRLLLKSDSVALSLPPHYYDWKCVRIPPHEVEAGLVRLGKGKD
jgi:hypothetical protein